MGTDSDRKSKKPKAQGLQGLTESESLSSLTQRSNMVQTLDDISDANVAGAVEALACLSQMPHAMRSRGKRRVLTQTKVPQLVDSEGTKDSCPVCFRRNAGLCKSMKVHSNIWHRHEAIRNTIPSELDLHHLDNESYSLPLDTELIVMTKSKTEFVVDLVTHSLACAARSLPIPKQETWAESWSRVRAFAIGRIGNAHCWVAWTELYLRRRSILTYPEGETDAEVRKLLKREARLYLSSLMSAVEVTPPSLLWQTDESELRRRNLVEEFFLDGKNHRQLGFIHPAVLPSSSYFP